eukprot:2248849-Pyramimonas_sp.AAC.1
MPPHIEEVFPREVHAVLLATGCAHEPSGFKVGTEVVQAARGRDPRGLPGARDSQFYFSVWAAVLPLVR